MSFCLFALLLSLLFLTCIFSQFFFESVLVSPQRRLLSIIIDWLIDLIGIHVDVFLILLGKIHKVLKPVEIKRESLVISSGSGNSSGSGLVVSGSVEGGGSDSTSAVGGAGAGVFNTAATVVAPNLSGTLNQCVSWRNSSINWYWLMCCLPKFLIQNNAGQSFAICRHRINPNL